MGLFSFVGKAIKGVGKVVGGALKVGIGAAKVAGGLGLLPGGGLIGKVGGALLAHKQPMAGHGVKLAQRSPTFLRGNTTQSFNPRAFQTQAYGIRPPAAVLRLSPVMPGGAVATSSGIAPRTGAAPAAYGGAARTTRKAKKRTARKTARRTARKSTKRKSRLKFGSPAWRKKYMKKRRRAA